MKMYDQAMAIERLTISLDAGLASEVRAAAAEGSGSVSAWFADAARTQLARDGLPAVIRAWEAEHGPLSDDELTRARRLLDR
jgi:hypothetical protein